MILLSIASDPTVIVENVPSVSLLKLQVTSVKEALTNAILIEILFEGAVCVTDLIHNPTLGITANPFQNPIFVVAPLVGFARSKVPILYKMYLSELGYWVAK